MDNLPKESLIYVNCDICRQVDYRLFLPMRGSQFLLSSDSDIVQCSSCGLLYTNPRPTPEGMIKLYETHFSSPFEHRKSLELSLHRFVRKHPLWRRLWHDFTGEYLSEMLDKCRGKILDIGCGFGEMLEDLAARGCAAYGIDANPLSVKICTDKGLNVSCGDLNNIHFPDAFFDAAILWHALEHLPSARLALREAHRILKSRGRVFIYCPNAASYLAKLFGKNWKCWSMPFHFYHFTPKTMQKLAESAGFKIHKIRAITTEYFLAGSFNCYIDGSQSKFLKFLLKSGILRSLPLRIFNAFIFRVLDLVFSGKGECLRVELIKS